MRTTTNTSNVKKFLKRNCLVIAFWTVVAALIITSSAAVISAVEDLLNRDPSNMVVSSEKIVVIKSGDTLWNLCSRYRPEGVNLPEFVDFVIDYNDKENGYLSIGEQIIIPMLKHK